MSEEVSYKQSSKNSFNKDLAGMLPEELEAVALNYGEMKYRGEQIFRAIHGGATDLNEARNLPASFRQGLKDAYITDPLRLVNETHSGIHDTEKFLFSLSRDSGIRIETVLISEKGRNTVCVSTQAGCNVGCEFCATARLGFRSNLTAGEICAQVYNVSKFTGKDITNVVYMGMGEPFLNYNNVLRSLRLLTHDKGLSLPGKRITVSTVGFRDRIKKFADDIMLPENSGARRVKLALSLHSTDNGIRESIIPVSVRNRLPDLYEELVYFYRKTGTKITYEYIHFPGVNDTQNDVKRLAALSRMVPCNINIIPFHPISFELSKPLDVLNDSETVTKKLLSNQRLNDLIASLKKHKVVVNLRASSGIDINAACGQLALSGSEN